MKPSPILSSPSQLRDARLPAMLRVGQERAKISQEGEFDAYHHRKGGASSAFTPSTPAALPSTVKPPSRDAAGCYGWWILIVGSS